jgi:PEP-CTERM motif-containing protein
MKRPLRSLALTFVLVAAATLASAQAPKSSNPAQRGDRDSFYYGSIHGAPQRDPSLTSPLNGQNGIGRPVGRYGPVTPVPEPSQWAMMLAGLALVGWIVRRNSKR